jgi:hypothetical protein
VRPVGPEQAIAPPRAGRAGLELFVNPDFSGPSLSTRDDVPSLGGTSFNDRAKSMIVEGGQWELCSEANYAGDCVVVSPGRYDNLGGLSNRLSSMRRVQ